MFDIFASCRAAACMVVAPENITVFPSRLAGWIDREGVTVWYSVPSVLTMLAEYGNLRAAGLSRLRMVIFAGEVFPAPQLTRDVDAVRLGRLADRDDQREYAARIVGGDVPGVEGVAEEDLGG